MNEQSGTQAARRPQPEVLALDFADLGAALTSGLADFRKAPLYGLFFGGVFAAGGLLALAFLTWFGELWLIIPIGIGFPLIGPFAAAGLYEVSRRLEAGEELTWSGVLVFVFRQREGQLGWMAFVVLFVFWIWLYQIRILIALFLGFKSPSTIGGFVKVVTTSQEGLMFLGVGTAVGAVLAAALFSITVIAMPLLIDSQRDFVTAMITSVKTVARNPAVMLVWALFVMALAFIALAPLFVGLLVIFPVLGHASWHLYRRAIRGA
ncbi:MAG: DUF2189 domain-containing protein [Alphaproteobacteria bacterium]|nr:DUF2189 domain-containing protein [Alphaproteobacteria bacterium]